MAEKVYDKARYEEVAPGMRVALSRASERLDAESFVKKLEDAVALLGEDEVGLVRVAYGRQWYAHVTGRWEPETVYGARPNFLGLMGWRVRELKLPTDRNRVPFKWGTRCKVTWRDSRRELAAADKAARDCDAAHSSPGLQRPG